MYMHKNRCLEPFLPLYDHFENRRFLVINWQYLIAQTLSYAHEKAKKTEFHCKNNHKCKKQSITRIEINKDKALQNFSLKIMRDVKRC